MAVSPCYILNSCTVAVWKSFLVSDSCILPNALRYPNLPRPSSGARILVISSLDSLPAGEEIQRQSKDADTSTARLDLQAVARLTVFLPPVRTIAQPCIKTIGSLGLKSTTNRNSHRLSSSSAYPRTRRIPWKENTAFPLAFA